MVELNNGRILACGFGLYDYNILHCAVCTLGGGVQEHFVFLVFIA